MGVKLNMLQSLRYENYRYCLENCTRVIGTQYQFHSCAYHVYTENVTKVALPDMDDKHYIEAEGLSTVPWGHYRIPELARKHLANPLTASRCGASANEHTAEAPVCRGVRSPAYGSQRSRNSPIPNDVLCRLTPQYSPYWSLSCVFIGCCSAPGSYGIRKVFPCKSAIGSEACRAGLINCDPIVKPVGFLGVLPPRGTVSRGTTWLRSAQGREGEDRWRYPRQLSHLAAKCRNYHIAARLGMKIAARNTESLPDDAAAALITGRRPHLPALAALREQNGRVCRSETGRRCISRGGFTIDLTEQVRRRGLGTFGFVGGGYSTVGCHGGPAKRLVSCVRSRRRLVARVDSWESRSPVCSGGGGETGGGRKDTRRGAVSVGAEYLTTFLGSYQLVSPLVDDRPMLNAVKYRIMSGVVWTDRTMVSLTQTPTEPGQQNFASSFRDTSDAKHIYSEVTFAIGSLFIRPALHASEPIAGLQGNTLRIP
ncbi:hypothetical protein PR048_010586 [Dryococelus australis]|uniref:Uncharacterized protein n=1 Tax=Dryococelus australis TaxID=614101 RepID=A0ABQ9I349_9NEOP|nr:hypothetical protein PR048_010586 [Dryococelus australis]